ncbi:hypothetical protein BYT27DRAFT_7249121 [Phlegmacium glaucopus]|nr:hypothetical protein BYT27DRAFT_7249121 [Phlegmacium glaucopus]
MTGDRQCVYLSRQLCTAAALAHEKPACRSHHLTANPAFPNVPLGITICAGGPVNGTAKMTSSDPTANANLIGPGLRLLPAIGACHSEPDAGADVIFHAG